MIGLRINTRGRYQCTFCTHRSWKLKAAAKSHVQRYHFTELAAETERLEAEVRKLQDRPARVIEKVVYRDPPKPAKPEFWRTTAYCDTCKVVITNIGIPRGQNLEETPHSNCGTKMLKLVKEIL